ncbi:MAG TPA: hypothetical protein DCE81_10410, partial [Cytophagales bacterium]|nr:hypothetical protein [Cytophagales bacterium]
HFYAWKKGLKTGMYYLRTNAAADAIKFTLDKSALTQPQVATAAVAAPAAEVAAVAQPVVTEVQQQLNYEA